MKAVQGTLYVTTPEAFLSLDGENVVLKRTEEERRLPLHNIQNIVCFSYPGISPALMGKCAEKGIGICFLTRHGRFLARVSGPTQGNILLRSIGKRIRKMG